MSSSRKTRRIRPESLILFLLLVLAAVIRLYHLDHYSFWIDEGATGWFASLSLDEMKTALSQETNPALFYLLAKVWLYGGQSDFWARLLPCLAGVLGVGLTYLLAAEVWQSRKAGLAAAALAALSPLLVMYSQEFRSYSVLYALSTACLWLLWRWSGRGGWLSLVALALIGAGGFYTHYLFSLYLTALALTGYILVWPDRRRILALTSALALLFLLSLPGIYAGFVQTKHMAGTWWLWKPSLEFIQLVTASLSFRSALLNSFFLGTAVQVFIAVSFLIRRDRNGLALMVFAYLPLLLMLIVSFAFEPVLLYRVVIPSVAPVLALAGGWIVIRGRGAGAKAAVRIVAAVMVLGAVTGLYEYFLAPQSRDLRKPDWRAVVARVEEGYRPGDAVVMCPPQADFAFSWYMKKDGRFLPRRGFPFDWAAGRPPYPIVPDDLEGKLAKFKKELGRPERIWMITLDNNPVLRKAFDKAFLSAHRTLEKMSTEHLTLRLLQPKG